MFFVITQFIYFILQSYSFVAMLTNMFFSIVCHFIDLYFWIYAFTNAMLFNERNNY